MEIIEVRFVNILLGLHGRFVYTRTARENLWLFDQYIAEAFNPNFPFNGMLVGHYGLIKRGLRASEVEAQRREGYAVVAQGEDLLAIWAIITDSVDRLNEAGFVYWKESNNSNAFINTALWRAGLPKVKPYKGFDENGYAPGFDVLLDLRPLRKGEVDEKPEDRQLRIPDNRNTIRGHPSKHGNNPNTKDDRGAIDPAPDEPSVATVEAGGDGAAKSAASQAPSENATSMILAMHGIGSSGTPVASRGAPKQSSPPQVKRRRWWPHDNEPLRIRLTWRWGEGRGAAAERTVAWIKDRMRLDHVLLDRDSESRLLADIQLEICKGAGDAVTVDGELWFKLTYPDERGYKVSSPSSGFWIQASGV